MPHSAVLETNRANQAIVDNLKKTLKEIAKKEHQSGMFNALITAVSGANISQRALAKQLSVNRKSVAKVMFMVLIDVGLS